MALYQDPNLVDTGGNLDISAAGNTPTWDITGMVYLPNSTVTFSGAVNKASNGLSCFGLTVGRHYNQWHRRHIIQHAMCRRRSYPPDGREPRDSWSTDAEASKS